MSALAVAGIVVAAVVAVAIVYWHLVTAEGAYLGRRVVARTYDWVSGRYDSIKQFDPADEDWFVAGPVLRGLAGMDKPLILDVATGTGRLPQALLRNRLSPGAQIVGLDLSRGMLRHARAKLQDHTDRVFLLWHDASRLPFDDDTFDAVTCLEALEFLPSPPAALAELVRVLAPGGLLLVTNRVGFGARLLPGRAIPRTSFRQLLEGLPLAGRDVVRWQVDYDLALAFKTGTRDPAGHAGRPLADLVRCPACAGSLQLGPARLACMQCRRVFPIDGGGIVALVRSDVRGNRA